MEWSEYQQDIFEAVDGIMEQGRDLVVLARAGTGKTTTMVEAVIRFCRAHPSARVLTCAFNVKNARDLQTKLADAGLDWRQATARTLNSAGLATCKKAWGKGVRTDGKKGRLIARRVAEDYLIEREERIAKARNQVAAGKIPDRVEDAPDGLPGKVGKLATMAKITLTEPEGLRGLCARFAIADERDAPTVCKLALRAMGLASEDRMTVDFDDQLWFPAVFDLEPWTHDLVIVDEAQDMNASQLSLARKSVRRGGRLVAVGDQRQAIYGWRGADSGFLDRMVGELGAATLPLPRTYRCGHAIVAEAQEIVPDYEADENNVTGEVWEIAAADLVDEVEPGDFILSRANAPLLPLCLDLLKRKIPANIQGRDIMGQLMGLVERSECETTDCLLTWLDSYVSDELRKLWRQDADEDVIDALRDRVECLRVLAPEHDTCAELLSHLDEVFTDRDDLSRVTLSSVHRAKGMERDRVFMLMDTFRSGGQEDNIRYVAITRAKTELVYAV